MGDLRIWYRIDKGDGRISVSNGVNVLRAAQGAFKRPNRAIAACRFQTQFAYYATGDKLTPEEDKALEAQERCVKCGGPNLGAYVCADCGTSTMAVRHAEQRAEDESLKWAAEGEETESRGRW